MEVRQARWTEAAGWLPPPAEWTSPDAQVVFVFGTGTTLRRTDLLAQLREHSATAVLFGCSTAGEILGAEVRDDTLSVTFVTFAHTKVRVHSQPVSTGIGSRIAGAELAAALDPVGLAHVILLSDGLQVNGTELVKGLREGLPAEALVTGGMAGDGDRFQETLVLVDGQACAGMATVMGLYGEHLRTGCGSLGGWDQFGPERRITRSIGNLLYELDGKSALGLYKLYLGEHSSQLPASGLLFPLGIRSEDESRTLVRTIMGVNEDDESLTFAGDVPEGWYARLMRANFDRLIDGATGAAQVGLDALGGGTAELALLISCVGRKAILKQRVEEEIEAVQEVLGDKPALTGFYSYGEVSPFISGMRCELHNQTMTITTFREI